MDQRVYLKVKAKSLAAEAKIIRQEEKKNKDFQQGLADHRKGIVRSEARYTLLAYGFLRGRSYDQLEHKNSSKPDWEKVKKMVEKYGAFYGVNETYNEYEQRKKEILKRFEEWKPK